MHTGIVIAARVMDKDLGTNLSLPENGAIYRAQPGDAAPLLVFAPALVLK